MSTIEVGSAEVERRDEGMRQMLREGYQLCPTCSMPIKEADMCPYHVKVNGEEWAASNRIMCDFFHRGILSTSTDDPREFWAYWVLA